MPVVRHIPRQRLMVWILWFGLYFDRELRCGVGVGVGVGVRTRRCWLAYEIVSVWRRRVSVCVLPK
jgi:hypothetical protein